MAGGAAHHHSSVQIPMQTGLVPKQSMQSSRLLKKSHEIKKGAQYQSRKDANPIGPQKTKSQVQANQKIELPHYDDDGQSEMETTEQNEMDPQNAQPEICEETSTISSDT